MLSLPNVVREVVEGKEGDLAGVATRSDHRRPKYRPSLGESSHGIETEEARNLLG